MKNKTFVVTGASQGIGKETALRLADMGATVVMVARDPIRGLRTLAEITEGSKNKNVYLELADLSSISSVKDLAKRIADRFPLIHGLINNHAALFHTYESSVDKIEINFALNHLSYFLLTNLLIENLKRGRGRIVNVSAHVHTEITNGDFLADAVSPQSYNPWVAYCQSKLANILFTYALARRLSGIEVTVNCLHPGSTPTLALKTAREIYTRLNGPTEFPPLRPLETAAETPLYLVTSPEVGGITGKYFIDCEQASSSDLSYDVALQEKLWELSSALTNIDLTIKI